MQKVNQETNAALEKQDYTYDHNGNILMVKKNPRLGVCVYNPPFQIKTVNKSGITAPL